MRTTSRPGDGFTLVEMLVVIAIISLLTGLLVLGLSSAAASARGTKCASNLSQVYAGLRTYAAYRDGFLPPSGSPPDIPAWWQTAGPFLGDERILACPSMYWGNTSYGLSHHWAAGPGLGDLGEQAGDFLATLTPALDDARRPGRTVFVCDAGLVQTPEDPPEEWRAVEEEKPATYVRFPHDNHLGQADGKYTLWVTDPWRPIPVHRPASTNCLFLDGHVEPIVTRDLVDDLFGEPRCLYDNK